MDISRALGGIGDGRLDLRVATEEDGDRTDCRSDPKATRPTQRRVSTQGRSACCSDGRLIGVDCGLVAIGLYEGCDLRCQVTPSQRLAAHHRADQRIVVPTATEVLVFGETPRDEFTLALRQFAVEHRR